MQTRPVKCYELTKYTRRRDSQTVEEFPRVPNWIEAEYEDVEIPNSYKKLKVKARYGDPIGLSVDQFLQF